MILAEKESFEIKWREIAKLSLLAKSLGLEQQVIEPEENVCGNTQKGNRIKTLARIF